MKQTPKYDLRDLSFYILCPSIIESEVSIHKSFVFQKIKNKFCFSEYCRNYFGKYSLIKNVFNKDGMIAPNNSHAP